MVNKLVAPIVKWVGGKRQLLEEIVPLLPDKVSSYCEPFVGGGAVLFSIQPKKAIVNDLNEDLIGVYKTVKDNVEELIKDLAKHENTPEYFYTIRDLDRDKNTYKSLSEIERASRIIYLNKTCFNGLFRVNSSGEFNAPFGYYKNPNIVNAPVLKAVSLYLNKNDVELHSEDFSETLSRTKKGCFVYLDPPYDPVSDTANFTGYIKGGFGKTEQKRLKECCDKLNERGIKFMLSNSATEYVKELYSDYNITTVKAKRTINSNASKRGQIEELLIRNYGKK